jgi:hypothetical protein
VRERKTERERDKKQKKEKEMGCKQSKSTQAVIALNQKHNDTNNAVNSSSADEIVTQSTQILLSTPNSIKNTTSTASSSQQQQQQKQFSTSSSVAVQRNSRTSDRVYKLLLKQRQNYINNSNNNNTTTKDTTTSSGTNSNNNNNTNPNLFLDETAVLQAMTPKAASYRNPETQFSPLHLAVQLIDSHSMATVAVTVASTLPTTNTNKKKYQQQQYENSSLLQVISELIRAYPDAVFTPDIYGYIPLHYAIAPILSSSLAPPSMNKSIPKSKALKSHKNVTSPIKTAQPSSPKHGTVQQETIPASVWPLRTSIVRLLLSSDSTNASYEYLNRNDIVYNTSSSSTTNSNNTFPSMNGCTPLYRIVQMIPDDDTLQHAPTLEYIHVVLKYIVQHAAKATTATTKDTIVVGTSIVCKGNSYDGDKPLTLLYRRFTRQFDMAEQFFDGDNSRTEVVDHRRKYKTAASNTWKIIELLLKQQEQILLLSSSSSQPNSSMNDHDTKKQNHSVITTTYRTVHRAVQGETPPDLLRYIVETNANDLTIQDEAGNLPLHYAARYQPKELQILLSSSTTTTTTTTTDITTKVNDKKSSFPAFYSKYVMDELLYKYPEAATIPDANGNYPLLLAIQSGKQWIGGGIKSLYDAYPDAIQQINVSDYPSLQRALSNDHNYNNGIHISTTPTGIDHDNEEKKVSNNNNSQLDIIRDEQHDAIMLVQDENVDISEVVTSMWAHEEDAGVQMLGCIAIRRLLDVGNQKNNNNNNNYTIDHEHCLRIALSAIPAVVNAMKAHPNEVIVQEKACHTLRAMASIDGQREVSFVASGAVAAIVGAMQAHVSDPNVQEEACGALGQILHYGGADRATVIASVSGVTAMMNAIAAHPKHGQVQQMGCMALCEMTNYKDTANIPELPRSQTEPLLEHAKTMFPMECSETVDILLSRLT